jgi:HK97 family phage major capsid protein
MNDAVRVTGGEPNLLKDPRRGFPSFGHFAHAIIHKGRSDERLRIIASAPSTFGDEAVGADGGFAVPPVFAEEIFVMILAGDSLMPLCDEQKTSANGMIYPVDESTPWGANGVIATWQSEGASLSQLKPVLNSDNMRLHKLLAFVPLSNELMDDAPALQSYLPKKAADAINWKFNQAILQGTGNGQPAGILNAPCTLIQAKDSGQLTQTISITNATNMLQRLPPGSHGRAVFITNTSTLGALLSLGAGASGYGMSYEGDYVAGTNIPIVGRLVGRPVVPTAHLNQFSTQGDLVLADFSYYRTLTRPGGIDTAWSLHVYFDADASAFRARFRCDGMPSIRAPLSPPGGALTYSPFIQLAAR